MCHQRHHVHRTYHHHRLRIPLLVAPLPKRYRPQHQFVNRCYFRPQAMAQPSPSSVSLGDTPSRGPTAPPISSLLPLFFSSLTSGFSAISYTSGILHTISRILFSPFLAIIPVAFYLLSPIIISSQILFDTFVGMPFHAAVYVLQALYPIYAFIGVACLIGIIVGLGARQVVNFVGWGLLGEVPSTQQRSASPSRTRPQRKSSTSRGKRKVTLKTED
ncbi:hypothetical protein V8E53_002815 [Lactarius tabidus]